MSEATETTTEAAPVTVHQAWSAVMADVRELGKGERNNTPGASFNFRGIDSTLNAVGPALRKHGVAVVPTHVEANHRDVHTSTGKPSREATVLVEFTVYGPTGDAFTGMAPGEAMDSGDKGTSKAMSVALRTFLLQSLCLPTQDTDPDAQTYERAPEPTPAELAQQCADELAKATDADRVRALGNLAHERGLLDVTVPPGVTLRELVQQRLGELDVTDNTTTETAADPAA